MRLKFTKWSFKLFSKNTKKKSKESIIKTKNYRTCGTNQNIENPSFCSQTRQWQKIILCKKSNNSLKKNNECNSVLQNQILSRLFCVTMNVYALFNFLYLKNSLKSNFWKVFLKVEENADLFESFRFNAVLQGSPDLTSFIEFSQPQWPLPARPCRRENYCCCGI